MKSLTIDRAVQSSEGYLIVVDFASGVLDGGDCKLQLVDELFVGRSRRVSQQIHFGLLRDRIVTALLVVICRQLSDQRIGISLVIDEFSP